MYFKSALAHLKSKIFSVANHGGWYFFTLETCWSYMFLLGPPLYINMTQKLLKEICQTSFWQLIKKKIKVRSKPERKKKPFEKSKNLKYEIERRYIYWRRNSGYSNKSFRQWPLLVFVKIHQHFFLRQQQKKMNLVKNKFLIKWHPVLIRWCLRIYLKSRGNVFFFLKFSVCICI